MTDKLTEGRLFDIAEEIQDNGRFLRIVRTHYNEAECDHLYALLRDVKEEGSSVKTAVGLIIIMVEVSVRRHQMGDVLQKFMEDLPFRADWGEISTLLQALTFDSRQPLLGTWLVSTQGHYARATPIVIALIARRRSLPIQLEAAQCEVPVLALARHFVYTEAHLAVEFLLKFSWDRPTYAKVIDNAELPATI